MKKTAAQRIRDYFKKPKWKALIKKQKEQIWQNMIKY